MRRFAPLALLAFFAGAVPLVVACGDSGPSTLSNGQTLPPSTSGEPPGPHDGGGDGDAQ